MRYFWKIDNNAMVIVDEYGDSVTTPTVTIDYRKRLGKTIEAPGITKQPRYDITVTPAKAISIPADLLAQEIAFITPLVLTGTNDSSELTPSIELPLTQVYYVDGSGDLYPVIDSLYTYLGDHISTANIANGTYTCVALAESWSEQDDGLDSDVQLAALYLTLSNLADIAGGDKEIGKYFFDKYRYLSKDLKRKYNSAKHSGIQIRPYAF